MYTVVSIKIYVGVMNAKFRMIVLGKEEKVLE